MRLDNFASCTIIFEQKDKGRQMSSSYIPAGKTTERSEKSNRCTRRQRPFQDLSESLNIVAVRQTVLEICSIFVFWHFANADPYGSSKVKGHRTMLSGLTS